MSDAKTFTSKLAGQHVIILGGTAGIGFAVAQACIEYGGTVTVSSSSEARVTGAIESIKKDYPSAKDRISGYTCDLSTADVEANIEKLFLQTGQVDHIVFTAGNQLPLAKLEDLTLEKMHQAGHIRSFAAVLTAKVGLKYLRHRDRRSSVIFTTGAISDKPIAGGWTMINFYATALCGLTRQLALDLAPVRVNIVSPGAVDTELWSHMSEEEKGKMMKGIQERVPTKAVAQSEDIAEAYLYLMKDLNVTGEKICTNSGATLI